MSLRSCSNCLLMSRNNTGMVISHAFHSCWRLFALDQIQFDAYCTVVWRRCEGTFKLLPVIPIFERNEMTESPRKPRQPTSIGITWHIQLFSAQSARNRHAVSRIGFSSVRVLPPGFLSREQSILWRGHSSLNRTTIQCLATFMFEWCELEIVEISWDLLKPSIQKLHISFFFISSQGIHFPFESELWVLLL